jgi:hypothetical protein
MVLLLFASADLWDRDRKMALGGQTVVIEIMGSHSFRTHCKILNYDATSIARTFHPFQNLIQFKLYFLVQSRMRKQ